MIRYANDIMLSELAIRLKNEGGSFQAYLTDGNLDAAFLRALTMLKTLDGIMERLNDIKYRSAEPQSIKQPNEA